MRSEFTQVQIAPMQLMGLTLGQGINVSLSWGDRQWPKFQYSELAMLVLLHRNLFVLGWAVNLELNLLHGGGEKEREKCQ